MSVDWINAIKEVGVGDLDAVNSRIASLEDELKGLRILATVFRAKLGIKSPDNHQKKKPEPAKQAVEKPKGSVVQGYREAVVMYLLHAGIGTKPSVLAAECKFPTGSIAAVLECPWFARDTNGVVLTAEGRRAAMSL